MKRFQSIVAWSELPLAAAIALSCLLASAAVFIWLPIDYQLGAFGALALTFILAPNLHSLLMRVLEGQTNGPPMRGQTDSPPFRGQTDGPPYC
jgi:hypothetical protein